MMIRTKKTRMRQMTNNLFIIRVMRKMTGATQVGLASAIINRKPGTK